MTGALLLGAAPAGAQSRLSPGGLSSGAPKPPPSSTKPAEPPPAAVPGARARPDTVVPADRSTADLPPTEALFDAINRGDIASARDAVSRGADLDATNLLGLTPTELSVDLGRNDITFLLLSLRGGGGWRGPSLRRFLPEMAGLPIRPQASSGSTPATDAAGCIPPRPRLTREWAASAWHWPFGAKPDVSPRWLVPIRAGLD